MVFSALPQDLADRWFVPLTPTREGGAVRVFAFPAVGGGYSTFAQCAQHLPAHVEMWSLNLPGRQGRFGEPLRTDLSPLVDELTEAIEMESTVPYALMGYCFGALLAFLVTRRLRDHGGLAPSRLIAVSSAAPDVVSSAAALHQLSGEEFWKSLLELGGFPPGLADEPDYRQAFEPMLRADLGLMSSFRFQPGPPFDMPITVIAGRYDTFSAEELCGWARQTRAELTLRMLVSDHWIADNTPQHLAQAIGDDLAATHTDTTPAH